MEGIIVNYRMAYTKEAVVRIPGITNKREARKLIGRKAVWTDEKKRQYVGKVTGVHGSTGAIRVKFKAPLPPKALGKVIVIE
ncbi:MAG: hypothetical protein GXO63_02495 [Candidatus Micrarchaeota archaeon]|nr:hypothetical protein [Candidatus Micrarchaeota archaeon]